MKPITINSMDKCYEILNKFRAEGLHVWQMQYRWNLTEGFHAWFMKAGHEDIEVVTKNKEVEAAIVAFNAKKPPGDT
jgi:hypothetical protein